MIMSNLIIWIALCLCLVFLIQSMKTKSKSSSRNAAQLSTYFYAKQGYNNFFQFKTAHFGDVIINVFYYSFLLKQELKTTSISRHW